MQDLLVILIRGHEVAADVGARYSLISHLNDTFTEGTPAQGRTTANLKQAIMIQLEKLKQNPISKAELQQIKY